MSDIADILGISHGSAAGRSAGSSSAIMGEEANKIMHASQAGSANDFKRKKKPKGMKREVFDLLGADTMVSSIQGNAMAPNFKNKRLNLLRGKWLWTPIHNSARACNDAVFFHWSKADLHNSDYPYAKFNVKLDELVYSDEEYTSLLADAQWTRADTDQLISCCHKYDLRWPVVHDRILLSCPRSVEDMQSRYYFVRAVLRKYRSMATSQDATSGSSAAHAATVNSCLKSISIGFDMELERKRRRVHDFMFRRTKQDEVEEAQLREDLKAVEAALKKTRKSRTATTSETAAPSTKRKTEKSTTTAAAAPMVQKPTRSILFALDTKLSSTAAVGQSSSSSSGVVVEMGPARGRPCLQSSRLYSTSYVPLSIETGTHIGTSNANTTLSKRLVEKMNNYLRELDIPENPLPTRAVCDLVEAVKRKTVTLLSLHNMISKRRKEYERVKITQTQEVATVVKSAGSSSRGGSQRSKQTSAATGARKESKSSKKANQGVVEVQSSATLPSESAAV